ncbi:40S ribosomal protein mrp2, mitochondrial [Chytriomyces hyalinus]|nr:40S ribosomal protein mrp2, mitochondrial [Chytriomyces hyalinus]
MSRSSHSLSINTSTTPARRDRDAWRSTASPAVSPSASSLNRPRPSPNDTHASPTSATFIAHIPQRAFSADTRAILREQTRRDPWAVSHDDSSDSFQFNEHQSYSLPRQSLSTSFGVSTSSSQYGSHFGSDLMHLSLQRGSQAGFSRDAAVGDWDEGHRDRDTDDENLDGDSRLIHALETRKTKSGGVSMMRMGSRKGSGPKRSNSTSNSPSIPTPHKQQQQQQGLPKERRHTVQNPLTRNKNKSNKTQEIFAPDDGRVDPLTKRPWWSLPGRGIQSTPKKESLPKSPPLSPPTVLRSMSLPVGGTSRTGGRRVSDYNPGGSRGGDSAQMPNVAIQIRDRMARFLVAHNEPQRQALKLVTRDRALPLTVRIKAQLALQQFPRHMRPVAIHSRCTESSKSRGFISEFKLSKIMFREKALAGELPGVRKATW